VFRKLTWKGLFRAQWDFVHLENFGLQELFLSKHNASLTWKKDAKCPASIIDGFLWSDTCVSSPQLNRHIWSKKCLSPPRIT
jgi:hypothetical protein